MYYRHQKSHSKFRLPLQIMGIGFFTLMFFCVGLYYLRTGQKENVVKKNNETETVGSNQAAECLPVSDFPKQTAVIKNLSDNLEIGSAERGAENGILYHAIKVFLPPINRETEFYQGWLVRQTPYDFFSTGELVTNELGEFILEWAGENSDIVSYDHVVITKELHDDNLAPAEQVAEGVFE